MKISRLIFLLVLTCTIASSASAYESVMIPVHQLSAGAYGSLWRTELIVTNVSNERVVVAWGDCPFECPPAVLNPGESAVNPLLWSANDGSPGTLLPVIEGSTTDLRFYLRAYDLSRTAFSSGAQLPVVRDGDFRSRVDLTGIPVDARFRVTLRAYSLDAVPPVVTIQAYAVKAYSAAEPPLFTTQMQFRQGQPTRPDTIQINDLVASHPELQNQLWIRLVISVPEGSRVWAFATVANNATQEMLVVAPN